MKSLYNKLLFLLILYSIAECVGNPLKGLGNHYAYPYGDQDYITEAEHFEMLAESHGSQKAQFFLF